MKIINCGIVTYIITEHHIATICYNYNNGQPIVTIYYDGQHGEIIENANGQAMRFAFKLARYSVRLSEYLTKM